MIRKFSLAATVVMLLVYGCSKTPDNAAEWMGTYVGTLSDTNNIGSIVITEVDPATVNIQLQMVVGGTSAVLNMPPTKLQSSYNITINASTALTDSAGQIQCTGAGTLTSNGDTLKISGHEVISASDSVKPFYFVGVK